jgi:hypothetical protein
MRFQFYLYGQYHGFLYASEQFFVLVRFEQRSRLDELPDGWKLIKR